MDGLKRTAETCVTTKSRNLSVLDMEWKVSSFTTNYAGEVRSFIIDTAEGRLHSWKIWKSAISICWIAVSKTEIPKSIANLRQKMAHQGEVTESPVAGQTKLIFGYKLLHVGMYHVIPSHDCESFLSNHKSFIADWNRKISSSFDCKNRWVPMYAQLRIQKKEYCTFYVF